MAFKMRLLLWPPMRNKQPVWQGSNLYGYLVYANAAQSESGALKQVFEIRAVITSYTIHSPLCVGNFAIPHWVHTKTLEC